MTSLLRSIAAMTLAALLAACQVSGTAPPSNQQTTGINNLGGPGSGAP